MLTEKKILIIPDKFKFTFSSKEIADIICNSLINRGVENIKMLPISDGGEGFIDAISSVFDLKIIQTKVSDASFKKINSSFAVYKDTAYIESSKTIGLQLLNKNEQNPFFTSSYGLGEQIKAAVNYGVKKIIVGLGGSATTDGGIGMASALGYKIVDKYGNELFPTGENLIKIYKVEFPKEIPQIEFTVACDVKNPLCGKRGAAFSFAGQKGANSEQIMLLDKGLRHLKNVLINENIYSGNTDEYEGAAGGLGFGIKVFLNGKLLSGSDYILNLLNVEQEIMKSDFIITGEGKLDEQSFNGKIVGEIFKLIKKYNKRHLVIAGYSEINKSIKDISVISLFDKKIDIATAKRETKSKIENINFVKLLK